MIQDFEEKSLVLIEERQEVITEIERAVFTGRYQLTDKHYTIFSTSSISLLYAIWEGFVQRIFALYVDQINEEGLELFSLCDSLIILCKERQFQQLKEYPKKDGKKISLIRKMKEFYTLETHKIPRTIDTESNVGFQILNKLMDQFNLDAYAEHWEEYSHPNNNLKENMQLFLRLRNTVAHGAELLPQESIDQKMYVRFKKLVLELMYDIRKKMIVGLSQKKYKK